MQLPLLLNFSFFDLKGTWTKTRNKLRSTIGAHNKGQNLSKKSMKLIEKYYKEPPKPRMVKYWFKIKYDTNFDDKKIDIEAYAVDEEGKEGNFKDAVNKFIKNQTDENIKNMLTRLAKKGHLEIGVEQKDLPDQKIGLTVVQKRLTKFFNWKGFE